MCWNTACTPQKHPAANTAVSAAAVLTGTSTAGAGIDRPSCAAEGSVLAPEREGCGLLEAWPGGGGWTTRVSVVGD